MTARSTATSGPTERDDKRTAHEPGDALNRRADLVRVAAQMFREKGFEGTTIRDIAHAVGMRSGSPFYHFANKHEILMAVMEEGLRLGLERTRSVLDDAALPADEQFRRLVRAHHGNTSAASSS
jgi:TetR/AcrR family transcriptional regulator, cholesterol catabolism regulator